MCGTIPAKGVWVSDTYPRDWQNLKSPIETARR